MSPICRFQHSQASVDSQHALGKQSASGSRANRASVGLALADQTAQNLRTRLRDIAKATKARQNSLCLVRSLEMVARGCIAGTESRH